MINAPDFTISNGIKCSICRADIKERHKMYQTSLKLGVICRSCRNRFSDEDIEMIVNIFFAFGGYFGKFDKSEFSIDDIIVEFAEQLENKEINLHSANVKMWHKVLIHGITPQEFLEELSVYVEQI
ncbi:hypothetical protein ES707_10415 [subsurface metagenome]